MNNKAHRFIEDDAAFTGLEAAIVLVAFVVVAATFSYVMLGAGFFASQKSKEVVHTGVDQATSSVVLAGDVIGIGDTSTGNLTGLKMTIQLTSGNNPVDINKTVVSVRTVSTYNASVFDGTDWTNQVRWIQQTNQNNLLEKSEKVQISITLDNVDQVKANSNIQIELKPPSGATASIPLITPGYIEPIMTLV